LSRLPPSSDRPREGATPWLKGIAAIYIPVGLITLAREAGLPLWAGFGIGVLGAWAGFAFRQAWVLPHRYRRAERLWRQGAPASEVLAPLDRGLLARGELGYRMHLLRSLAHLERDNRPMASGTAAPSISFS